MPQDAKVIWMTGLSGAGKSTLAQALKYELGSRGITAVILDGDELRRGINSNLGFSESDRMENIRRAACMADLLRRQGIWCIAALITPMEAMRHLARQIIGSAYFHLVYIKAPLEVCIARDPKNLYKKALKGEIPDFTGISAPFEEPENADLHLNTSVMQIDKCVDALMKSLF
ncbi:adenylyl-sulfate kinase [Thermaurantimonas aggregans]|uniref:Adenylyl-sulfate kinase n=1 Tax=Thermaurantimonas aggregans TaxID=2173829 RepID=A0A401XNL7_9FLAO|nr:adenylyl-sulfate kinase [Thermaurantimonas aggregans]MCX8148025.1 adenylyl-sulfate kinase [Thermaurantimonas aggregans]GCD78611.1 adenylyl-sulfate kinase [Thermaurantimonas aggregans]